MANPEKHAEYSKRHRDRDPARYREQRRNYLRKHPDVSATAMRNRRARIRESAGKHTVSDVRAQVERQKGRCYWCGKKTGRRYHVDHVVPIVLGGSNGPENIVIACVSCNLAKGAQHPSEFAGVML
jgi:5-methylcytosine-specific restriction endonuclease McrA